MKQEPFSYSRLTGFEACPKKFYHLNVAKTVKEAPNEKTDYGTKVHEAFAKYLTKGTALPLAMRQYRAMLDLIKQQPGEHVVEQKVAINADYAPTGWFDADVYCRVISDLTILHGQKAAMFDWKTGRPYDDFTQLRLAGAVLFLLAPEIEEIILSFVWLQNKTVTKDRMTKADGQQVWVNLAPRIQRYQNAHHLQAFPATPGVHCKWCPLKSCPHNESRR
jgi:hypothetical protein